MKIHCLRDECLEALKVNMKANLHFYQEPTNDWIYDYFDGENPFIEFKKPIDDFEFSLPADSKLLRSGKNDVENTIRFYSAMKGLTDTQACDERLWAGLAHSDFWSFINLRLGLWKRDENVENKVKNHYFLFTGSGPKRSLFINILSKMWWVGRLTYDPDNKKDPFALTRYLEDGFYSKSMILFSSNFTSNKTILKGLFSALIKLNEYGLTYGKRKDNVYIEAAKYLNVLGGTHILDYYTAEEIEDKVMKHMLSLEGARTSSLKFGENFVLINN